MNKHGGIAGHPVRVIFGDDGGDPSRGAALTKDLVENKKVVAFIGNMQGLSLSQAQVQYLERKHVPVIGGDITTGFWYTSPMLFPSTSGPTENLVWSTLLLGQRFSKMKKLAFLACAESNGCAIQRSYAVDKGYAKKAGWDVVYTSSISITQIDFTSECIQMQQRQVEALDIVADGQTLQRLQRDCSRQGFHPWYVVGAGSLPTKFTASGENVVATDRLVPFPLKNTRALHAYHEAMSAAGLEAESFGLLGWAAGALFEKVVQTVGARPVTTDNILAALWSLKHETLGGLTDVTFAKSKPAFPGTCNWPLLLRKGSDQWSFPLGNRPDCTAPPA